jgi:cytochrome c oxidase subunit 2
MDAGGNRALGAPALAGQLPVYLERQLHMFRRDIRGTVEGDSYGAQMRPFAVQLPDGESIAALAAWLGSLPSPAPANTWEGDARRGASLYNGNCGACHGGRAEGNEALKAPRLAGLDPAYLERQVLNFQSGVRGGNPRDRLGRQMATMAATLTGPEDLDDILAYIAGLAKAGGEAGEGDPPP